VGQLGNLDQDQAKPSAILWLGDNIHMPGIIPFQTRGQIRFGSLMEGFKLKVKAKVKKTFLAKSKLTFTADDLAELTICYSSISNLEIVCDIPEFGLGHSGHLAIFAQYGRENGFCKKVGRS